MSLTPGTKLGPYEIVSPLGAGGMGEVYRAKDTRLDRTVAIKILAEQFSKDPIRKQRFEREAKAISGLNHPNICTLHDVGSQNGTEYLVMEYVDGESLAQRLAKGPLPIDQVLKVGREIADALDRAHRSGIVHRDLKPGNIMLTKAGAKLLDFGLARSASPTASIATLTGSAVPQAPVTEEGTIVGTFQYMSPEQIEGKELDARSDIFSLGAVLYEMVTGQRAFEGKSQLSVASAILEKEPAPISGITPVIPRNLEHIIRRCLAKDPDERWQSARDLALELTAVRPDDSPAPGDRERSTPIHRQALAWLSLALALVAAVVTAFSLIRSRSNPPPVVDRIRSSILAPVGMEFSRWAVAAVSPDGKHLVYSVASPGWGGELYLRHMDSMTAKPLPGTDRAQGPFWSPDSKWIAFAAGGKLQKISVDGGNPLVICDSAQNRGGAWSPNGTILFVPGPGAPVYAVPENGGAPVPVTQLDKSAGELAHRYPVFLPDGKHFLFLSRGNENVIYASSLDSKERKPILRNDTNVLFVNPGYLLFVQNSVLLAQPFDANKLELSGKAVPIADDVPVYGAQQRGLFSVSRTGLLVMHSKPAMLAQLSWVDLTGKPLGTLLEPRMLQLDRIRISPDGRKVAVGLVDPQDGTENIWLHDIAQNQTTRLTFENFAHNPVWAPGGGRILYDSNHVGFSQIFSIPAAGVSEAERFLTSDQADWAESFSPDGRYLIFSRAPVERMADMSLWVLPLFGDQKPYPLFPARHAEAWDARFSPDGKWLAYVSTESGDPQVYLLPFPDAHFKIKVSKDRGLRPHWSPDGRELFYIGIGKDRSVVAATLRFTPSGVEVADSKPLFKLEIPEFELSRDGTRFLIFKIAENQEPSTLTLINNWISILAK